MKKGQGLSMNVIIIAAIALLILVILTTLVLRQGNILGQTNECQKVPGGQCMNLDTDEQCPSGYAEDSYRACPEDDQKCCIPIEQEESS